MTTEAITKLLATRYPSVQPFGADFCVFRVASNTTPGRTYHVDLSPYDFNGRCDCHNFNFRMLPALEAGAVGPLRCRHIVVARHYQLDLFLMKMSKGPEA